MLTTVTADLCILLCVVYDELSRWFGQVFSGEVPEMAIPATLSQDN